MSSIVTGMPARVTRSSCASSLVKAMSLARSSPSAPRARSRLRRLPGSDRVVTTIRAEGGSRSTAYASERTQLSELTWWKSSRTMTMRPS
jgi:hypothetical protein